MIALQALFNDVALSWFPHFATVMLCMLSKELRNFAKSKGNYFWRMKLICDCRVYCDEPAVHANLDVNFYFFKYMKRINIDFPFEWCIVEYGSYYMDIELNGQLLTQDFRLGDCGWITERKAVYLPENSKCVQVYSQHGLNLCLLDNGKVLKVGDSVCVNVYLPVGRRIVAIIIESRDTYYFLLDNGKIFCHEYVNIPKCILDLSFKEIKSCREYSIGLLNNGSIFAWGNKCEFRSLQFPLRQGSQNFVSIDVNYDFFSGLLDDGTAICWFFEKWYSENAGNISHFHLKLNHKIIAISGAVFLLENGKLEFPALDCVKPSNIYKNCHTFFTPIPIYSTYFRTGWYDKNTVYINKIDGP